MRKSYTFKSELMMLFSFSVFVPVLISLVLLFGYFTKVLTDQNLTSFENTLNSVSNNIDTYLDDLERLTLIPYMYNEIFDYMSYLNSSSINDEANTTNIDIYSSTRAYVSTLNKLINSSRKDILAITFIPTKDTSKSYLVSKHYDTLTKLNTPKEYTSWIDASSKSNGDIFFTPVHDIKYEDSSNEYRVFSLMRAIKNPNSKNIVGYIKVDSKESTLKEIISSIKISNNSQFYLLDDDKQVIYSTSSHDSNNLAYSYDFNSNEYIAPMHNVLEKNITSNNWTLLYLDSKLDLYTKTALTLLVIILVLLLCFVFSILLFKLKTKNITESMSKITSSIEDLETGNISTKFNVFNNHEFEYISNSLYRISEKMNLHIKNEYEAIIKEKEAKYIALQTQINPHFLNNILTGFISLNRIGEKKLLEDALIQLSQFYRYTCKTSNISTLEEEFNCIEKYLLLEKLRFDDMVEFNLSLHPDSKDIKIPKLILQPLVENSIKHGLKNSEDPIHIEVSSSIKFIDNSSVLFITINDNGVGFDTSKAKHNDSTGIENIRERLHLFESTSDLKVYSTPNVSTTCTITLPLKEDFSYDYTIS